jgi:hypothetical protein
VRRSVHFGLEDRRLREIVVLSPSESAHRTRVGFGMGPSPRRSPGGRGSLSHFACASASAARLGLPGGRGTKLVRPRWERDRQFKVSL